MYIYYIWKLQKHNEAVTSKSLNGICIFNDKAKVTMAEKREEKLNDIEVHKSADIILREGMQQLWQQWQYHSHINLTLN
jgi:hypothetical protein